MPFYRFISTPENAALKNSNHGLTTMSVHPDKVEELKALGRIAGEEFDMAPEAVIIPLDVFDSFSTFDFDGETVGVEIEVVAELEGVCCFSDVESALNWGDGETGFMMIFEGEKTGEVWDGDLARVDSIVEVMPAADFYTRFGGEEN